MDACVFSMSLGHCATSCNIFHPWSSCYDVSKSLSQLVFQIKCIANSCLLYWAFAKFDHKMRSQKYELFHNLHSVFQSQFVYNLRLCNCPEAVSLGTHIWRMMCNYLKSWLTMLLLSHLFLFCIESFSTLLSNCTFGLNPFWQICVCKAWLLSNSPQHFVVPESCITLCLRSFKLICLLFVWLCLVLI